MMPSVSACTVDKRSSTSSLSASSLAMGATAAGVFMAPARRTASAATLRSFARMSFTSSAVFALASFSAA